MTLKSEVLAKFVVETTFESIPTDMVEKAKRHILDSVGAGIAGARSVEVARLMATLDMAAARCSGATTAAARRSSRRS